MSTVLVQKDIYIPVIIPAYEPDARMTELVKDLASKGECVVIVDDGSGKDYEGLFDEAMSVLGDSGILLRHEVNRGKGAALKTAFKYVIDNIPRSPV